MDSFSFPTFGFLRQLLKGYNYQVAQSWYFNLANISEVYYSVKNVIRVYILKNNLKQSHQCDSFWNDYLLKIWNKIILLPPIEKVEYT